MFGTNNSSKFGQQNFNTFGQLNSIGLLPRIDSSLSEKFLNVDSMNNGQFASRTQGTSIKYNSVTHKRGYSSVFSERYNCITCMEAYEHKSLEELRWEDYQLNRNQSQQHKTTSNLPEYSLFPNRSNALDKAPISKPTSACTTTINGSGFKMDPTPQSTMQSINSFNVPPTLSAPTFQTSVLKQSNDAFNFTPGFKPSTALPTDQKLQSAVSTEPRQFLSVPAFSHAPVNENIKIPPDTKPLPQPTPSEFYDHVQNVFQPYPRRDYLANIDLNFNMQNRTTDPRAIEDILKKFRAADDSETNQQSSYSPVTLDCVKRSFFEDVETYVPSRRFNRALVLNKTPAKNESGSLQNVPEKTCINNNTEETYVPSRRFNRALVLNKTPGKNESGSLQNVPEMVQSPNYSIQIKKSNCGINLTQFFKRARTCTTDNKSRRCLNLNGKVDELESNSVGTSVINLSPGSSKVTQTNKVDFTEAGVQVTRMEPQVGDCRSSAKPNVKLTKADYYTIPPFDELHLHMDGDHDCVLNNFVIGRSGFGKVRFLELVNLSNLDLDEIIDIDYRYVAVYPDDNSKPPVGQGLNVKAEITIDQIWPLDKSSNTRITDVEQIMETNFIDKLKRMSEKQNSSFINYLPGTGSWIFSVEHF